MRQKLRNGDYPAYAPIGYLNELRHHTIIKDPQRAEAVKKVFEAYATGKYTLEDLQKLSFSIGLAGQRKGKAIAVSKIQTMLKNPFYYGLFVFKGETYQGNHEPIISKQLFEKCQRVMRERGKPQAKSLKPYAFRGVFKCGECGRPDHRRNTGQTFRQIIYILPMYQERPRLPPKIYRRKEF